MSWDSAIFGQLPYLFLTIAIVGTIYRYQTNRYSWSSQSSQFVENKVLFFGSFPWHFGIILILSMHIFAIFLPGVVLSWNAQPARLYLLEISGLLLAILALWGLVMFIYRRLTDSRVRALTTSWDILVLIILVIQVASGIGNAVLYNWGSNWYAAVAVPYIWSILTLNPDVTHIANLPLITKIHIFNAFVFILFIPFSRFVHFLAFVGPIKYLFRPYQVVRWYGVRTAKTPNVRQYK